MSIAAKLLEASLSVSEIPRRGRNEAEDFAYATADDVFETASEALMRARLQTDFEVSGARVEGALVLCEGALTVTDPETGEQIMRRAVGSGSGARGLYRAMTGARKYALIHLLGLTLGEDPDEDGEAQSAARNGRPYEAADPTALVAALAGRKLEEINMILGAAGIDGARGNTEQALAAALEKIGPDEAAALSEELAK